MHIDIEVLNLFLPLCLSVCLPLSLSLSLSLSLYVCVCVYVFARPPSSCRHINRSKMNLFKYSRELKYQNILSHSMEKELL